MGEPFDQSFWSFKLDAKHRVSLPAYYRDQLKASFGSDDIVLTINPDGCLNGHPLEHKGILQRVARKMLAYGPNGSHFERIYRSTMQVVTPDQHGRFVISGKLHAFAKLGKTAHFIGMGDRFEIWDARRFDELMSSIDYEDIKQPFEDSLNQALEARHM